MSPGTRRIAPPYLDSVRRRRRADLVGECVPSTAGGFVEPLLDGGAVAVALLARHPEWSFVLGSPNRDLVTVWETVRTQGRELVERVAFHAARHSPAYFEAERELASTLAAAHPESTDAPVLSDVLRAARFVYLRGTAAPGPDGVPRQSFSDAVLGREVPAFDASGVLELAAVLSDRDVEFVLGEPFAFLPWVGDDDVVLLEVPTAASAEALRTLRSFTGAVTAKGAALLLAGGGGEASPAAFDSWRELTRLDGPDERAAKPGSSRPAEPMWGNRALHRRNRP